MIYAITVILCTASPPCTHIRELPDTDAAFAFAFAHWPRAVVVAVRPVQIIHIVDGRVC